MGYCRAADLAGAKHAVACPEAYLLNASAKNLHAELPLQADLWMMSGSSRNTFFVDMLRGIALSKRPGKGRIEPFLGPHPAAFASAERPFHLTSPQAAVARHAQFHGGSALAGRGVGAKGATC